MTFLNRNKEYNWQLKLRGSEILGVIIFKEQTGIRTFVNMNNTGAIIWFLLNGNRTATDVCNTISGLKSLRHINPKRIQKFINTLKDNGLCIETDKPFHDVFGEEMGFLRSFYILRNPSIVSKKEIQKNEEIDWEGEYKQFFEKQKSWSQFYYPVKINLDITLRCNLHCPYCYFYSKELKAINEQKPIHEPSLDELKAVVDKIFESHIRIINLFGGEPLIRKDIFELIEYIKDKDGEVTINTNGILLDRNKIKLLKKYRCSLEVNLDGMTPREHDRIRSKGSFHKLMTVFRYLRQEHLAFQVNYVISPENYKNIFRMATFVKKVGAFALGLVVMNGVGRNKHDYVTFSGRQLFLLFRFLDSYNLSQRLIGSRFKMNFFTCDAFMSPHIGPNFTMNFCVETPLSQNLGNVKNKSILEIWHSKPFQELYDVRRYDEPCMTCLFKKGCYHYCRAEMVSSKTFYANHGDCTLGKISLFAQKALSLRKRFILQNNYDIYKQTEKEYDQEIIVRENSSDALSFEQVFVDKQYDFPLPIVPRVILDIGAYVGYSALWFSKNYPQAKIIAIEPDLGNYETLLRNTSTRKNVKTIYAAIWNKNCPVVVKDVGRGQWSYIVQEPHADDKFVSGFTIESIMQMHGINEIDLIKIDIEGSEKFIFASGSDDWIDKTKIIVIEVHNRFEGSTETVENTMKRKGFTKLEKGEDSIYIKNNLYKNLSNKD